MTGRPACTACWARRPPRSVSSGGCTVSSRSRWARSPTWPRSSSTTAACWPCSRSARPPFRRPQRRAISEAWRAGRLAVLGVHSATDACHGWEDYGRLLGARFDGHPWTQDFDVEVVDRSHPSTAHLGPTWPWRDEIYLFAGLRPDARVLLRLADGQAGPLGARGAHPRLRVPPGLVPSRGGRAQLLQRARALPGRLGDPGLPPSPRRAAWPGSSGRTEPVGPASRGAGGGTV